MCGRRAASAGMISAGTIMPGFRVVAMNGITRLVPAATGTATGFGAISAASSSGRPRCMSAGSAMRTAIRGRAGRPAGTVAMRRFHLSTAITPVHEPAQALMFDP
jgi:hypothetical protein